MRMICGSTASVSNVLYNTLEHYIKQGYFDINDKNVRLFNKLHPTGEAKKGRYQSATLEFNNYVADMFTYADSFLNVVRWHASDDGRLSEQFDKYSGFHRGAHDLTWGNSKKRRKKERERVRNTTKAPDVYYSNKTASVFNFFHNVFFAEALSSAAETKLP